MSPVMARLASEVCREQGHNMVDRTRFTRVCERCRLVVARDGVNDTGSEFRRIVKGL